MKKTVMFSAAILLSLSFCLCACATKKDAKKPQAAPGKEMTQEEKNRREFMKQFQHSRLSSDMEKTSNDDFQVIPGHGGKRRSETLHDGNTSPIFSW